MVDPVLAQILKRVATGVYEIDKECTTRLNGIEHGLVNVKLEFRDRALRETGRNLTEETLIHWLLRQKISTRDCCAEPYEVPYPNDRQKKCDLLVDVHGAKHLWIELKMAWKAWFNCTTKPTYSNRPYLSYLDGNGRTHSFRHDLEKLSGADLSPQDDRAVCLVGFDYKGKPMDEEVAAIVSSFKIKIITGS